MRAAPQQQRVAVREVRADDPQPSGVALPGRLRLIGAYFAYRYALLLWRRAHWHGDGKGGGPLLVPYYLAENVIELATAVRGAARYRTPVL